MNYADAIASIESAGKYDALGPVTPRGNRAYGRYQVMDFNIGPWSEKYVGRRMTPDEFLADPKAQDAVFNGEFGSYVSKYGNPQDAASAWFSGRPLSQAGNSSDGYTTVPDYVRRFTAALGGGGNLNETLSTSNAPAGLLGQPEQPRGLLGMKPDTLQRLSMALMAASGYQGFAPLIAAQQDRISQAQQDRKSNQTVEYIRRNLNRPDLAAAVEAGAIGAADAYKIASSAGGEEKPDIREVNGRLVRVNTDGTTTEIYGPQGGAALDQKDQLTQLNALRDDLRSELGSFNDVQSGYENLKIFFTQQGPAADYALAVGFAKILDPGSVAREGEVSAVANSGSLPSSIKASLINALEGKGSLPPEVRDEIMRIGSEIYDRKLTLVQPVVDRYKSLAQSYGLPEQYVYMGSPMAPATGFTPSAPPKAPAGISQEDWSAAWSAATPEERKTMLGQSQ